MSLIKRWLHDRALAENPIRERVWQRVIEDRPIFDGLSDDELLQLRELTTLFVAHKHIHGAQGLEIDDRVRVTIGAQACLPVLNLGIDCYDGWREVIVYPDQFVPEREEVDEAGVVHVVRRPLSGEAWLGGPVILSWADVDWIDAGEGMNVVIHEFAHKLDMRDGAPNGLPPLHKEMSRRDWSAAFSDAYAGFSAAVERGEETAIDPYAAESPGEFFAVLSEAFFEIPWVLREAFPAIYEQMHLFYRQDPAARRPEPERW